ncbi:hypothetical protein JXO59_15705 [candidate division KSB1 bacterium]|nr:hypothetical protein [candidate division KSB1 bacterium]
MRALSTLFLCLGSLGLGLSCSYYSFSGSLEPHLKTIAVSPFDNRTAEFGVAEDLNDTVISEFNRDNTLKIADRNAADILIEGTLIQVEDRAGAFDESEQVQDMKVYLSVEIKCTDQVKRQPMWQERLTQWGSYDPALGPDARRDGIAEAVEKLSQDILNKTVANW